MEAPPHPTRALISLDAFRHNLECVRSYCGRAVKIMAVVKANAYGHGMCELSREAIRAGVDYLAVARVEEALEIREAGIISPLLVFEIPLEMHIAPALAHEIELSVSTAEGAASISRVASRMGRAARVHLKVDTGMGRLGFAFTEAARECAALLRLPLMELASVYSHFATAEDRDPSFALQQVNRFDEVIDQLHAAGIEVPFRHMANSAAIIALPNALFDMVRPGIMLYGYTPARGMAEKYPVRPVMSLVSKVMMLKSVEAGTSISYGRRFIAADRTCIATVPIGYADGYPRLLTNRTSALIRGKRYPVVGTICMDQLMIDVGREPGCAVGDDVTLIGSDGDESITAWDLSDAIGTIPYEVTSLVTPRVRRVFLG